VKFDRQIHREFKLVITVKWYHRRKLLWIIKRREFETI
jgi:hypothetical protein